MVAYVTRGGGRIDSFLPFALKGSTPTYLRVLCSAPASPFLDAPPFPTKEADDEPKPSEGGVALQRRGVGLQVCRREAND